MVSYRKLWIRLAEKELKKKDLCRVAGISATVVTKLGRGESVTTDVLARICRALHGFVRKGRHADEDAFLYR